MRRDGRFAIVPSHCPPCRMGDAAWFLSQRAKNLYFVCRGSQVYAPLAAAQISQSGNPSPTQKQSKVRWDLLDATVDSISSVDSDTGPRRARTSISFVRQGREPVQVPYTSHHGERLRRDPSIALEINPMSNCPVWVHVCEIRFGTELNHQRRTVGIGLVTRIRIATSFGGTAPSAGSVVGEKGGLG